MPKNRHLFDEAEEQYLQRYFRKIDKTLGIEPETHKRLEDAFNRKLAALTDGKRGKLFDWKSFSASVVGAFTLGLIVARFLFVPAEVATRGVAGSGSTDHVTNGAPTRLITQEPEKLAIDAIRASFDTDLEITVIKLDEKIQIVVRPLRPYSKDQAKVKQLLNIKDSFGGEAIIILSQKP